MHDKMAHAQTFDLTSNIDPSLRDDVATPRVTMQMHSPVDGPSIFATWEEPPVRQPMPSFMDYRGLERQGVLQEMQPLGQPPTNKHKMRAGRDSLRKNLQSRQMAGLPVDEARSTPDRLTPAVDSTRAGSQTTADLSGTNTPLNGHMDAAQGLDLLPVISDPHNESQVVVDPERIIAGNTFGGKNSSVDDAVAGNNASDASLQAVAHVNAEPSTPAPRAPDSVQNSPLSNDNPLPMSSTIRRRTVGTGGNTVFDRAFEEAARQVVVQSRPELANAITWLRLAAGQDLWYAKALFDMSSGNPTEAQAKFYGKKLHQIKKHVRDYVHSTYFSSDASDSRSDLDVVRTPSQSPMKAVDDANTATLLGTAGDAATALSPVRTSRTSRSAVAQRTPTRTKTSANQHSPRGDQIDLPAIHTPPSKKTRSSKIGSTPNAAPAQHTMGPPDSAAVPPPPVQEASVSRRSSSSSLSDVDQVVIDQGPPIARSDPPTELNGLKRPAEDDLSEELEERRKRLRMSAVKVEASESSERPIIQGTITSGAPIHPGLRTLESIGTATAPVNLESGIVSLPPPTKLGRPPKRSKPESSRVKLSPQKPNRNLVVAGLPPGAKRNGHVGEDDEREILDNSDYCTSCGGTGLLLCCDGCDRSFHFTCLDPPVDTETELEEPWFCYTCKANRGLLATQQPGLFRVLLQNLDRKNPVAYRLPQSISTYFESVQPGEDGEYTEVKRKKLNGKNADAAPDLYRLRDAKNSVITCNACGGSALGGRPIITCDYCVRNWHLDCLSPPLANPPSGNSAWMCPGHNDHDLRHLDPVEPEVGVAIADFGRAHRVRKPREFRVVDTHLRRGHRNNGLIEIANEPEDDYGLSDQETGRTGVEDEQEDDAADDDDDSSGIVYRLPEYGVKLDFIHKVKDNRLREELDHKALLRKQELRIRQLELDNLKLQNKRLSMYTVVERNAAVGLADFASLNPDLRLPPAQVQGLITALEAQVPQYPPPTPIPKKCTTRTKSSRSRAPSQPSRAPNPITTTLGLGPLTPEERDSLQRLEQLIKRRLGNDHKPTDRRARPVARQVHMNGG